VALIIKTTNPAGLLSNIKKAIDNSKIDTWTYDDSNYFTHIPKQWNKKAWLNPIIEKDKLLFGILGRKNEDLTRENYAVYHGRFAEMLVCHFAENFTEITTTPNPVKDIDVRLKLV
jgi:hypothetical protein